MRFLVLIYLVIRPPIITSFSVPSTLSSSQRRYLHRGASRPLLLRYLHPTEDDLNSLVPSASDRDVVSGEGIGDDDDLPPPSPPHTLDEALKSSSNPEAVLADALFYSEEEARLRQTKKIVDGDDRSGKGDDDNEIDPLEADEEKDENDIENERSLHGLNSKGQNDDTIKMAERIVVGDEEGNVPIHSSSLSSLENEGRGDSPSAFHRSFSRFLMELQEEGKGVPSSPSEWKALRDASRDEERRNILDKFLDSNTRAFGYGEASLRQDDDDDSDEVMGELQQSQHGVMEEDPITGGGFANSEDARWFDDDSSFEGALTPWAPAHQREPPDNLPKQPRGLRGAGKGRGKRKTAKAQVFIRPGTGEWTLNRLGIMRYYRHQEDWLREAASPLLVTSLLKTTDVQAFAQGGGLHGKAGAIKLALARAIVSLYPEQEGTLQKHYLLTPDPRVVEPKKKGRRKARKRPQWSKR